MFCPKLVDLDTTAASHARGTHPSAPAPDTVLLTVNLADGTPRSVFLSDLTTQVSRGVLTATGTVDIPGQGRDAFTAVVRAADTSDTSVALILDLGSLHRGLLRLVTDVSHLLDNRPGAGRATNYVAGLLTQILPGTSP